MSQNESVVKHKRKTIAYVGRGTDNATQMNQGKGLHFVNEASDSATERVNNSTSSFNRTAMDN